ncbi:unnamed protein product [Rhizoctonia solani]|uniref:RING-type domain-containing protein n=1 Tax=Rhizoctonia solani TaxID=456999 RepID=A0A8H3C423_9AGAM|nr:unnamed protein product [Rhizoctonia solani]
MGQETSALNARGDNQPSSRRISRYLRRGRTGDSHGRPHSQEEGLEAPTPGPDNRPPPGDHHLDDDPYIPQGHRLVRAHHPQPQQAPPTTQTRQTPTGHRSPKEDRVGGTAMAQPTEATLHSTAATGQTSGQAQTSSTLAQVSSPTASSTEGYSHRPHQSLESRERILDSSPSTTPTTSTPTTQPMEYSRERVFDSSSSSGPTHASTSTTLPPITTVESLQSALANSHTPDSHSPAHSPTLSPSALPALPPQQPLTPSSSSNIPRIGTTMIVQGLVQTIEVTRIPPTAPTTEDPNPPIENALDKQNEKDTGTPALGSTSAPISNTSASDANTPDTLLPTNDTLGNTTPRTSPSSTDVLGLLLSIAAQATAEALVPWSVPPRSRAAPREGIASGLAAAFSALAGAGTGVTTTNPSPATETTPSEPPRLAQPPPEPRPQPQPRPTIQTRTPEPRPSHRRFSRLSLSPGRIPSLSSRRISALLPGRRSSSPTPLASNSTPTPTRHRRASSAVLDRLDRWVPRLGLRRHTQPTYPLDESVDFGRAPPVWPGPVSAVPESSVSPVPSPGLDSGGVLMPSSSSIPVPTSSDIPVPTPSDIPILAPSDIPLPMSSDIPPTPPTTDAEDLIRFSQMLGFTPGIVHPTGTFERFLADMQDELRVALGEYHERVRGRGVGGMEGNGAGAEENEAGMEGDAQRSRLDHTRPHVPSTDPLPLNWWRMYRFPALPDGGASSSASAGEVGAGPAEDTVEVVSASPVEAPTSPVERSASPVGALRSSAEAPISPTLNDTEPQQPIHPAIIIGLRSITRDLNEEPVPAETEARPRADEGVRTSESEGARLAENGDRVRSFGSGDRVRRRFRLGEEEERRREGTRNYIIWIIGGYYPSNHSLLAHPNLFLGQVHPDELWMLNELLGQVKPPTVSREDIAKAGLRTVKGAQVKELAETKAVTENCTERCLICLDDYEDDDDLRIMNCKHMFHKACVDHWMEVGRNNCPACRTKGIETTSAPESPSTPVS